MSQIWHLPWSVFSLSEKLSRLDVLCNRTYESDFWQDYQQAQSTVREINNLRSYVDEWQSFPEELCNLRELCELVESNDFQLHQELESSIQGLSVRLNKAILNSALSGPYDHYPAIVTIQFGSGGNEAQYWTSVLMEMYCRWAKSQKRDFSILDVSYGEALGTIRHATLSIDGSNTYGLLQSEAGVHRLSRVSTFDPARKRHTSFARVEIMPDIPPEPSNEISLKDLKFDVFHASGPGGQAVNKLATAVRVTHLPTGTVAASQSQRSQFQNKEDALRILYAKLAEMERRAEEKRQKELRGEQPEAAWSHQIRSYVLNPNQLVADHRTGFQTGNAHSVLEGNLESFIEAYLWYRLDKVN